MKSFPAADARRRFGELLKTAERTPVEKVILRQAHDEVRPSPAIAGAGPLRLRQASAGDGRFFARPRSGQFIICARSRAGRRDR